MAVVSQSTIDAGPSVWFPLTFGTAERRMVQGLRGAAMIVTEFGRQRPHAVFVQERGEWTPA